MNKKSVSLLVAAIIVLILGIIIVDFLSQRPNKMGENPYAYDVEEFKLVDPKLINYKEVKNIPVRGYKATGIDIAEDTIWLCGEGKLQAFTSAGNVVQDLNLDGDPTSIHIVGKKVFVSMEQQILVYSTSGELEASWKEEGDQSVFTSMAHKDGVLYVADAGKRRVMMYDLEGNIVGSFEGKAESNAGHGFIIPSASFDLLVNSYGELWVVNPGKHAIENYSDEGEIRGFWQNISMNIEGFSGCCNPAEIAVLENGYFVTSEKGLVRIKIYDQSGKFLSVVAPPSQFEEEGRAPEVVVDEDGRIWALDFDRSMIRVWELELSGR